MDEEGKAEQSWRWVFYFLGVLALNTATRVQMT